MLPTECHLCSKFSDPHSPSGSSNCYSCSRVNVVFSAKLHRRRRINMIERYRPLEAAFDSYNKRLEATVERLSKG